MTDNATLGCPCGSWGICCPILDTTDDETGGFGVNQLP